MKNKKKKEAEESKAGKYNFEGRKSVIKDGCFTGRECQ